MPTRVVPLVVLALLVLPAAPAGAAAPAYSGFFLVGEPLGFFSVDACVNGNLEGINSNCVALAREHRGMAYNLTTADEFGTPFVPIACFYDHQTWLGCDLDAIPFAATHVSVSALGGVGVRWTLAIE